MRPRSRRSRGTCLTEKVGDGLRSGAFGAGGSPAPQVTVKLELNRIVRREQDAGLYGVHAVVCGVDGESLIIQGRLYIRRDACE